MAMAKRRHRFAKLLVAALVAAGVFASFWLGLVPQRWSPFAPLSLSEPSQWFVDLRLAALRRDRALCRASLIGPAISAQPIDDQPIKDGCGWQNAVSVSAAGGARINAAQLTCEAAAALALWMQHEVQPAAMRTLGSRVTALDTLGTYACRNIIGSRALTAFRSQHATANAIDISAFRFADGRSVSLARDWSGGDQRKSEFLRLVHARACAYFRVALSPDFNAAHRDHFHFDRGLMWRCK